MVNNLRHSISSTLNRQETWQEDFRNSLKSNTDVNNFFNTSITTSNYSVLIPKKFAQKILAAGRTSPLWQQFIPHDNEADQLIQDMGMYDPIGDSTHSQSGQLIHRYNNRVLFMPTTVCPVICRYCFRKNELSNGDDIFKPDFKETITYLESHPQINEIIFSGGDPLILSDERIEKYLKAFSRIPHIKFIRFHTRTPIILPNRITDSFVQMLERMSDHFIKLQLVIHTNHTDELDTEVCTAIGKFKNSRVDLLSQSVMLKGINNNADALFSLIEKLIDLNIRPYYLHHPDHVRGGMHFHLPLEEGRRIYSKLRNLLPGWALPQYILDIPGGEGKTNAYNPESYEYSGNVISRKGNLIHSPEKC